MPLTLWIGLPLTLVAGLCSGSSMLPMKFAKRWPWENTWLVFTVVSLAILPWALAFTLLHDVFHVYAALPAAVFIAPLLFGFGWGIAQVLFGLSIARLGMALGFAIIVGLGALLGTLVPLFVRNREIVATGRGAIILLGVAVMVLGIAVSARAGMMREGSAEHGPSGSYVVALAIAVLCGLMAPMLNFAFAFGQGIALEAVRQGASPKVAGYAVWPIALLGGLIPNAAYSCWLLSRNRTWRYFRCAWRPDVWFGCLMGVLWMGAFAVYGVSSVYLGALGTSVGWALFQIFMIMTANLSGVLTGEWKNAPAAAKRGLWVGLVLLAAATTMIAAGNL
ncbi:MAG: L-rhamnose/proton symporter RhaT [Terracidiphilus sp.]|jgi:L-rhamnose-H+ transport protein